MGFSPEPMIARKLCNAKPPPGMAHNCRLSTHPELVEGWRFDKLSDRASDTFVVYPFQSGELTQIRHPVALIQQEDQERGLAGRAAPARNQDARHSPAVAQVEDPQLGHRRVVERGRQRGARPLRIVDIVQDHRH